MSPAQRYILQNCYLSAMKGHDNSYTVNVLISCLQIINIHLESLDEDHLDDVSPPFFGLNSMIGPYLSTGPAMELLRKRTRLFGSGRIQNHLS